MIKRFIGLALSLCFLTGASLITEHTQWLDTDGEPIVNGSVYIGTKDADPEVSPITIYSDRELTSVLANPQSTDSYGRTTNKIWVPGQYSIKVEDTNGVQKFIDLDAGEATDLGIIGLSNVQGTNTITAEAAPTITAYTDKQIYSFTVANANTGAVTVNIDGVGAKNLERMDDGEALAGGELQPDMILNMQYNSAHDIMEWLTMPKTVTGPAAAVTSGRVASFNGTSGVKIQDSGKDVDDVVTGPASVTDNNAAIFDGTGGDAIKEPTTSPSEGDVLTWNSSAADWVSGARIAAFTSSSSWTAPYTGTVILEMCGGGGGGGGGNGGNGGGGGGSGNYSRGLVSVTDGTSYTVGVASGGTGGTAGNSGNSGGSTSFGSTLMAVGGGTGGQSGGAGGNGGAAGSITTSPTTVIFTSEFSGANRSGATGGTGAGNPYSSGLLNDSTVGGGGAGGSPGGNASQICAGGGGGNDGATGGDGGDGILIIYY